MKDVERQRCRDYFMRNCVLLSCPIGYRPLSPDAGSRRVTHPQRFCNSLIFLSLPPTQPPSWRLQEPFRAPESPDPASHSRNKCTCKSQKSFWLRQFHLRFVLCAISNQINLLWTRLQLFSLTDLIIRQFISEKNFPNRILSFLFVCYAISFLISEFFCMFAADDCRHLGRVIWFTVCRFTCQFGEYLSAAVTRFASIDRNFSYCWTMETSHKKEFAD